MWKGKQNHFCYVTFQRICKNISKTEKHGTAERRIKIQWLKTVKKKDVLSIILTSKHKVRPSLNLWK
jgi:hypothetical protein